MDVLEAIMIRRSVRAYANKPIPADILDRCKQALRFAPSACNYQPWRFIFVSDLETRRQLARMSNEQLWMAEAPIIVVGCGLPDEAYKFMAGSINSVDIDVAIAMTHLMLVAAAEGLGTCLIGAFDEQHVKRLVGVPPSVRVIAMTPLGYPASPELNFPVKEADRKRPANIFHVDRYGRP